MSHNRTSLPLRLRDELLELIASHDISAGGKLPSEPNLCDRFNAGRTSIREALRLLEQDGYIHTRHGAGRYLTRRPTLDRPLTRLEGVTEMLASRGYRPHNFVLDVSLQEPSQQHCSVLRLDPGEALLRLERLRRHDDDALVYSVDYFRRSLVPSSVNDVDWTGSLFDLLAQHGHQITYAVAHVRAVELDDTLRQRVADVSQGAWLQLTQTHHDADGYPLVHSEDYHRGTDFSFHLVRRRD